MRYILYDRHFTPKHPFFRIGMEGMDKEQLIGSWVKLELDERPMIHLNNLVLTDLDTFFKTATSSQRREVNKCLAYEMWDNEETCLPF